MYEMWEISLAALILFSLFLALLAFLSYLRDKSKVQQSKRGIII